VPPQDSLIVGKKKAKSDANDTGKLPQTRVDLLPLGVATDPLFCKKTNKIKVAERGGFEPHKILPIITEIRTTTHK
jgi:hypothetical protein